MNKWSGIALTLLFIANGAIAGPTRVVSMNLCTDQLAMMLAAPGQLLSVSHVARDPLSSSMADEAMAYPVNYGLAEEIYLLKPDLVVAGAYLDRTTMDMLHRLGVKVEVFQPVNSLQAVTERIQQMGKALSREHEAQAMVRQYQADLAGLEIDDDQPRPRAAMYSANGYTPGPMSLAGQIMKTSGFDNIAEDFGYRHSGPLPLELLALANPDLLVSSTPYSGGSRSEDILHHPVVQHLATKQGTIELGVADWFCGTPHALRAVAALATERQKLLNSEDSQ